MEEETIEKSIRDLGDRFKEHPLEYTVEASLLAELQNILRDKVDSKKIDVNVSYKDFDDDCKHDEDFTDYKKEYLEKICDKDKISNVQIEVNIGGEGKNRLLDLAVLEEDANIYLVNGTKYFDPEFIEHALELKFIKNKDLPPPTLEQLDEDLNEENFLERDLKKLKEIDEEIDGNVSKYLVIFSNKNIFQNEVVSNDMNEFEDNRSEDKAHDRIKALKEYCDDKIKLYHYFPR